jgi:hypothetical protein
MRESTPEGEETEFLAPDSSNEDLKLGTAESH